MKKKHIIIELNKYLIRSLLVYKFLYFFLFKIQSLAKGSHNEISWLMCSVIGMGHKTYIPYGCTQKVNFVIFRVSE
jgi:hypothetical protein